MEVTWLEGETALRWPWLVVGLSVLVLGLLVFWAKERRRTPGGAGYVAHTARLRALPRFHTMARQRLVLSALTSLALLIAVAGTIILGGRLAHVGTHDRDLHARDVILCLDASGSMAEYNRAVLQQMQEVVAGLEGERVGLAIFHSSTITVFPLTDDYEFAQAKLAEAESAFTGLRGLFPSQEDYYEYLDFIAGTIRFDGSATSFSQIGDGLASCVQRFGDLETDRGRAVILASDNEPIGSGAFTLMEASDYAIAHDVVVHGIATDGMEDRRGQVEGFADELAEFEAAVTRTGGIYGNIDQDSSAAQIVDEINRLEAAKVERPPVVHTVDRPATGVVVTSIGVGLLVLLWIVQGVMALAGRRAR
jgi:hypothetical protein